MKPAVLPLAAASFPAASLFAPYAAAQETIR